MFVCIHGVSVQVWDVCVRCVCVCYMCLCVCMVCVGVLISCLPKNPKMASDLDQKAES